MPRESLTVTRAAPRAIRQPASVLSNLTVSALGVAAGGAATCARAPLEARHPELLRDLRRLRRPPARFLLVPGPPGPPQDLPELVGCLRDPGGVPSRDRERVRLAELTLRAREITERRVEQTEQAHDRSLVHERHVTTADLPDG